MRVNEIKWHKKLNLLIFNHKPIKRCSTEDTEITEKGTILIFRIFSQQL
jgi:hypothetical protein